ncbi:MAG: SusE domain-containing protein, partial [Dysgonamonadaceae bacterium]
MKKINIILSGILFMAGFYACQEDDLVTINPLAETGELTFKLNQPKYADYIYVLEEVNNDKDMDTLTCAQPDYGFTAAVTYHVQASFHEDMTESVELATPVNGEKVPVNIKDMNRAILTLYSGQMPNPPTVVEVYVRLKAIVSTATPTPLDTIPIVKPVYSNVIKLNILPYFMEDLTSYDKAKNLVFWYIIGLGDKNWTNDPSGLGVSVVPLS